MEILFFTGASRTDAVYTWGQQSGSGAALCSQWHLFLVLSSTLQLSNPLLSSFLNRCSALCLSSNTWKEWLLWQHYFFAGRDIPKFFLLRKMFKELDAFIGGFMTLWVHVGAVLQNPLCELIWPSFFLEGNSAVPGRQEPQLQTGRGIWKKDKHFESTVNYEVTRTFFICFWRKKPFSHKPTGMRGVLQ